MFNEYKNDLYLKSIVNQCLKLFDNSRYDQYVVVGPDPNEYATVFYYKNQKNVIIFTVDNWGNDDNNILFVPMHQRPISAASKIADIAIKHPGCNFFIFTAMFDMSDVFSAIPNIKIIHWGNDMIMHPHTKYQDIEPQTNKNYQSSKHWIFLSHNHRMHRVLAGMYLLGLEFDKTGVLRFSPNAAVLIQNCWPGFLGYCRYNEFDNFFEVSEYHQVFQKGFNRIHNNDGYHRNSYSFKGPADGCNHTHNVGWNHSKNFDLNLRNLYRDSFFEVVGEPVFMVQGATITEKYLNSVYGMNFPIILCVPGAVAHLRELGFDMFDDVVDHSYDTITSPMHRLIAAVNANQRLFIDGEFVKNCWKSRQSRFMSNVALTKQYYSTQPARIVDLVKNLIK
jgi:hypothetical protein